MHVSPCPEGISFLASQARTANHVQPHPIPLVSRRQAYRFMDSRDMVGVSNKMRSDRSRQRYHTQWCFRPHHSSCPSRVTSHTSCFPVFFSPLRRQVTAWHRTTAIYTGLAIRTFERTSKDTLQSTSQSQSRATCRAFFAAGQTCQRSLQNGTRTSTYRACATQMLRTAYIARLRPVAWRTSPSANWTRHGLG